MVGKMNYTKGEWKACDISYAISYAVVAIVKGRKIVVADIHNQPNDEALANANPIATSPDLYEACKTTVEYLESLTGIPQNIPQFNKALGLCDKALAKAEGK